MSDPSIAEDGVGGVLTALADPTRRHVLDLLADLGEATAGTLAAHLPISRQAVVKHLGILESARLVTSSRTGREVRFRTRPDGLRAAAAWMDDRAEQWQRRLESIRRIAESGHLPASDHPNR